MIYLASASPRRQELLRQVGLGFEALPSLIMERRIPGESPVDYVRRLATEKARRVATLVKEQGLPVRPVLGVDTEVVMESEVFGKPRDHAHAAQMLSRLSGGAHTVLSALCLVLPDGERLALSESRVYFAPLSHPEIVRYVATGECDGKAGGYAIQGAAAGFIARLEGSYSGVMGLPLFELREILQQSGLEYT